jgi:hypothetical protein
MKHNFKRLIFVLPGLLLLLTTLVAEPYEHPKPREGVIQLQFVDYDLPEMTFYYGFAVAWSDERKVAFVSPIGGGGVAEADEALQAVWRHHNEKRWQAVLVEEGVEPKGFESEFVGWYQNDDAVRKREERIRFFRDRLGYEVHSEVGTQGRYSVELTGFKETPPPTGLESHTHHFQFTQFGLEVRGTVTFNAQFQFFGYPYLKANYSLLSIDAVTLPSDDPSTRTYFDETTNSETRGFIQFPYRVVSGGHHLKADFDIRLPSMFRHGNLDTIDLPGKGFTISIDRLTTLADTYDDDAVDEFFRNYQHPELFDADIWEASTLDPEVTDPVRLRSISQTILREIYDALEAFRKEEAALRN